MAKISEEELTQSYNRLIQGYIHTQLLWLCSALDLPKLLTDGNKTLAEISRHNNAHQDTLRRFMAGFCALNLVEAIERDLYGPGPLLKFVSHFQVPGFDNSAYAAWGKVLHTVKTAKPAFDDVFGQSFYQYLDNNPTQSSAFDIWNAQSNGFVDWVLAQYDFSQFKTLTDLGGGQGTLILKLLQAYPDLKGIVFDRSEVIEHTRETLAKAEIADDIKARIDTQSGSFFESLPENTDGYILSRVLLNWQRDDVIRILQGCKQAMHGKTNTQNSKLLIIDFYLPEPDHPAYLTMLTNDLNQLVNWGGGLHTPDDWQSLVESAGLEVTQLITSPSFPLLLLEAK